MTKSPEDTQRVQCLPDKAHGQELEQQQLRVCVAAGRAPASLSPRRPTTRPFPEGRPRPALQHEDVARPPSPSPARTQARGCVSRTTGPAAVTKVPAAQ